MTARRLIEMAGRRFGDLIVLRRAHDRSDGHAVWLVACSCGVQFTRDGDYLRSAERSGRPMCCKACRPRARSVPNRTRHCTECGSGGHSRRECPRLIREKGKKPCEVCADLPHRRKRSGCPECNEPHIPEPPVTLADVELWPRPAARVWPSKGGW